MSSLYFVPSSSVTRNGPCKPKFRTIVAGKTTTVEGKFRMAIERLPFTRVPSRTRKRMRCTGGSTSDCVHDERSCASLPRGRFVV